MVAPLVIERSRAIIPKLRERNLAGVRLKERLKAEVFRTSNLTQDLQSKPLQPSKPVFIRFP
jgi:hypothetical protein